MTAPFAFAGRRALVTGASSGIGRACAGLLHRQGLDLLLLDVSAEALADTAATLPGASYRVVDLTDAAAATHAIDELAGDEGLSYIAHCAGIHHTRHFDELDTEAWMRMLSVNLISGFTVARAASRHVAGGMPAAMVAISSIEARRVVALSDPQATFDYAAAKSGLEALVRNLAYELGPRGIRVNAVAPGPVDTAMTRTAHGALGVLPQTFADHLIIKRYATADEIAEPIAFLLSESASYITGTVLTVDGGFTAL